MNLSSFQTRIRIISICICVFAVALIAKLFLVQIVHKNIYSQRADKQYATPAGDVFNRGTIFFTKKDGTLVPAATVSTGFKIAIKPPSVTNPESLYTALQSYITLSHDAFISKVSNKSDPYEEVATHLSKEQADAISALNLAGVSIYKDSWRFYPGGSLASHTLGFLAFKGDDRIGQYGLERYYNATLSKPKDQEYVNFFAEVFSDLKNTISDSTVGTGDIVTTIEPATQQLLESELKATMDTWHGDQAGGIIMNPMNGEIYAMSGMPDFDLNNFGSVSNTGVYRNPLVENVFEFGSVIKPLVMSAALDQGVVTPETTYFDKGSVVVDGKTINNFDKKGRGVATMQTVLDQSLNTGMVFVQSKLGHDKFRSYMKSFGIGEKTGIDIPNETSGLIKNLESPRDIEYANAAFGQGIALTPIEAIRSFASLANGGSLVTPHLTKQIRYDSGLSTVPAYPLTRTGIIKKETADTITRMLVHVFEGYDGGAHKMDHYSIATKTGTAQVALENGKGYYPDRHTHSFFGYFPAYNPKFIVFLFIKNPKQVKYASQTLIPPFMNITKFLINYYDVPPDR